MLPVLAPAPKSGFNNLPPELAETVASCLTPVELADYAKVNRYAHLTAQFTLKNKSYLESLPAYLSSMGIRNKLTLQAVQGKQLSVRGLFKEIKQRRQQIVQAQHTAAFSAVAKTALADPAITVLILDSMLELDDVRILTRFQINVLQSEAMREYLCAQLITINDALEFTPKELFILEQPPVKKYLLTGLLEFEQVDTLNFYGLVRLNCPVVQKYIETGYLTVMQAAALTAIQYRNLCNRAVQRYVATGLMPFEDALNLTLAARLKVEQQLMEANFYKEIHRSQT